MKRLLTLIALGFLFTGTAQSGSVFVEVCRKDTQRTILQFFNQKG